MLQSILEASKDISGITVNHTRGVKLDNIRIVIDNSVSKENLILFLEKLYSLENDKEKFDKSDIILDMRGLNIELLGSAIKYSLEYKDLKDPIMLLNIINLVKTYNSLSDDFFADEYVYVKSLEDLLDLKDYIENELDEFIRKLSIYFLSILKSCNKFVITPLDNHEKMPTLFERIFLSLDIISLCGIFTISKSINTDECLIIDDAYMYMTYMVNKFSNSNNMLNDFLLLMHDKNKEITNQK